MRNEKEDRWQKWGWRGGGTNRNIRDKERGRGGGRGRVGSTGLTSAWFNILLYSVLRASRVTRTRPS